MKSVSDILRALIPLAETRVEYLQEHPPYADSTQARFRWQAELGKAEEVIEEAKKLIVEPDPMTPMAEKGVEELLEISKAATKEAKAAIADARQILAKSQAVRYGVQVRNEAGETIQYESFREALAMASKDKTAWKITISLPSGETLRLVWSGQNWVWYPVMYEGKPLF